MRHEESFHSIQSVLSVLGEIHLLETYFNGFEKTLSTLLADDEVSEVLSPARIFNVHSDVESVKSDIHAITKKLLIVASELSAAKEKQKITTTEKEFVSPTNIKIVKSISKDSAPKNIWIENASKYFYNIYKNNDDEDGEQS
tara:strand:- start:660 stop:1085 length:426 start_codon:yes stop_codon:yes gene_type:complete